MPLPTPGKNESQDKFMERCMGVMHSENEHKPDNEKRPQKQMVAICMSQWKEGKADSASAQSESDFLERFLEKYPEYKEYFKENK